MITTSARCESYRPEQIKLRIECEVKPIVSPGERWYCSRSYPTLIESRTGVRYQLRSSISVVMKADCTFRARYETLFRASAICTSEGIVETQIQEKEISRMTNNFAPPRSWRRSAVQTVGSSNIITSAAPGTPSSPSCSSCFTAVETSAEALLSPHRCTTP